MLRNYNGMVSHTKEDFISFELSLNYSGQLRNILYEQQ